jgi:hypothetical protein
VFDPQATNTLVFDVLGTLLDEPAAFARAASAAAHAAGLSAEPLRETLDLVAPDLGGLADLLATVEV